MSIRNLNHGVKIQKNFKNAAFLSPKFDIILTYLENVEI